MAIGRAALQVTVLIGLAALRGADFHITASGLVWFMAATLLFTVFMYGLAETVASRMAKQEDYIGATPALATCRSSCRGAVPISAMPGARRRWPRCCADPRARLMRYGLWEGCKNLGASVREGVAGWV